ncbi:MAG: hypothetical protein ACM3O5_01110 [Betaproteobacteria bacterium]
MVRLLVSLVLASIAALGPPAGAKDKVAKADEPAPPAAVSRFLMGTRLGYITCSGKYRTYLEKRDLYELVSDDGIATPRRMDPPSTEETKACIHETVYKAQGLREAAARHASTPAAKTALREYTTAWEASLTNIEAKQAESLREFDARQKRQEARLDDLQRRVESTAR